MDRIINTQWGELYCEKSNNEYMVFPAPDFVNCVLYDYVSDNEELIEAVNAYHLEEEPILWRELSEYGNDKYVAYEDFRYILEHELDVPILES